MTDLSEDHTCENYYRQYLNSIKRRIKKRWEYKYAETKEDSKTHALQSRVLWASEEETKRVIPSAPVFLCSTKHLPSNTSLLGPQSLYDFCPQRGCSQDRPLPPHKGLSTQETLCRSSSRYSLWYNRVDFYSQFSLSYASWEKQRRQECALALGGFSACSPMSV